MTASRRPPPPFRSARPWTIAVAALFVAVSGLVWRPSPAAADPPGPTDYRSEIVAVEPTVPGLDVEVLGGDAFLQLTAPPGSEVLVPGYQEEPYLRFSPDGTVFENRNSPTTYLNADRFGDAALPARASADAEPDWSEVADGGRYAWHDHRIHWMLPEAPAGLDRGQQILEGEVPILVDGRQVEVRVASTWLEQPSLVPIVAGGALGLAVVVAGRALAGRRSPPVVGLVAALAAVAVAGVAYWSVPPETGPSVVPVALPVLAVALAGAGWSLARWRAPLVLAAAAELLLWAYLRRGHLGAAVLPTDAPFWLDRSVTAAVAGAAVALVALAVRDGALGELWPAPPGRPATLPPSDPAGG